jgi:peptidoglycan LD-endopeptidase CwlK
VVIFGVTVYFLLVLAALAWWLVPGLRNWLASRAGFLGRWASRARQAARGRAEQAQRGSLAAARTSSRQGSKWLRQRAWPLAGALAALVAVPAAVLVVRDKVGLDTFDHKVSRDVNPQIASLLTGEQLVPPPPVPPEFFLTREVAQARPQAATANRQWELLDGEFRQRLLGVFKLMREQHGLELVLIEGYRSPQRQIELADLGPLVTHAGAGESWHQYGMAADCAFLIDGRIVISEADPRAARGYALYGAIAQSAGLTWGGGWRSIKDLGHVELRRPGVMRKM